MRVPVSYPVTDWQLEQAAKDNEVRYQLVTRLAGNVDVSPAVADAIVEQAIENRLRDNWTNPSGVSYVAGEWKHDVPE
jgi:hypothetical protein